MLNFVPRESKKRKFYETKTETDEKEAGEWNSGEHLLDRASHVATALHANADRATTGHQAQSTVRRLRANKYAAPAAGSVKE